MNRSFLCKFLLATATLAGASYSHSAEATTPKVRSNEVEQSAALLAKKGCKNIDGVSKGGTYIYKNSAPLRSGGIGTRIVGFRREPTLIMNKNVSSRGRTYILDSKGNTLGSCPWASAHGHSGGRFRCTMSTSSLRRKAVKNTGKPAVFFKVKGSLCAEVPDAGRCFGSVKGLCNQTLR